MADQTPAQSRSEIRRARKARARRIAALKAGFSRPNRSDGRSDYVGRVWWPR